MTPPDPNTIANISLLAGAALLSYFADFGADPSEDQPSGGSPNMAQGTLMLDPSDVAGGEELPMAEAPETPVRTVTDYDPARDTITIEFPAETDPGDLGVRAGQMDGQSIISLGGKDVAMVEGGPVDPGSVVLQGV